MLKRVRTFAHTREPVFRLVSAIIPGVGEGKER